MPLYCVDPRHGTPCPLPCQGCEEEGCDPAAREERAAPVGPSPHATTVRVIIGTLGSEATVYEVDAEGFRRQQDTKFKERAIAEWVVRNGREVFRTPFSWAYGIGGMG